MGETEEARSFFGSDMIICAVTGTDHGSVATIIETVTSQIHLHYGLSSNKAFSTKLRPYGNAPYYMFNCFKPADASDVLIRFVEYH